MGQQGQERFEDQLTSMEHLCQVGINPDPTLPPSHTQLGLDGPLQAQPTQTAPGAGSR